VVPEEEVVIKRLVLGFVYVVGIAVSLYFLRRMARKDHASGHDEPIPFFGSVLCSLMWPGLVPIFFFLFVVGSIADLWGKSALGRWFKKLENASVFRRLDDWWSGRRKS
jgi:hypothetical protein